MNAKLSALFDAVVKGNKGAVEKEVQDALAASTPAEDILQQGLIAPMNKVGELFEKQEYFVPEMLVAARAMQAGLARLRPLLAESGVEPVGKVSVGTVQGDLHDIGKNLVIMMLEGAGFEVTDLGVDVPPAKFVDAAKEGAQIIAMSALLTTTMVGIKTNIEALETAGIRDKVKVLVGGAPLTQAYADQIGADGYGADASSAVRAAKKLVGLE
jgi:5-methyltetrahydrofolate--homocysteine methyltransferase